LRPKRSHGQQTPIPGLLEIVVAGERRVPLAPPVLFVTLQPVQSHGQQTPIPGLLEIVVAGERFRDTQLLHHDETILTRGGMSESRGFGAR
jgi:hypothetical protein